MLSLHICIGILIVITCSGVQGSCRGVPTNLNATTLWQYLESPNYDRGGYSDGMNCQYRLRAGARGGKLVVEVLESDIEGALASYKCPYDFVKVYDGPGSTAPLLGEWCGSLKPRYHGSSLWMFLQFRSDYSQTGRGFRLRYRYTLEEPLSYGCNNFIRVDSTPKYIVSPNFPGDYPDNTNCWWKVTTDTKYKVKVTSKVFSLENANGCPHDSLSVYNDARGQSLLTQACGFNPMQVYTTGNVAYFRFKSDGSISGQGFNISVVGVPDEEKEVVSTCRDVTTSLLALEHPRYLVSPNFPYIYDSDMDCTWLLEADNGTNVIKVQVLTSHLEYSTRCSWDYVEVYDGRDRNAPVLGRWCASDTPQFYSSGRFLTLHFHSDGSSEYTGFRLQYSQVAAAERPSTLHQGVVFGIVFAIAVLVLVVATVCTVTLKRKLNKRAERCSTRANSASAQARRSRASARTAASGSRESPVFFTTTVFSSNRTDVEFAFQPPPAYPSLPPRSPPSYSMCGSPPPYILDAPPPYPATQFLMPKVSPKIITSGEGQGPDGDLGQGQTEESQGQGHDGEIERSLSTGGGVESGPDGESKGREEKDLEVVVVDPSSAVRGAEGRGEGRSDADYTCGVSLERMDSAGSGRGIDNPAYEPDD